MDFRSTKVKDFFADEKKAAIVHRSSFTLFEGAESTRGSRLIECAYGAALMLASAVEPVDYHFVLGQG